MVVRVQSALHVLLVVQKDMWHVLGQGNVNHLGAERQERPRVPLAVPVMRLIVRTLLRKQVRKHQRRPKGHKKSFLLKHRQSRYDQHPHAQLEVLKEPGPEQREKQLGHQQHGHFKQKLHRQDENKPDQRRQSQNGRQRILEKHGKSKGAGHLGTCETQNGLCVRT